MAKRKTAMGREPKSRPATGGGLRAKPNMPMQRLSPGVYRSASGGLVTQRGRQLRSPTPAPARQAVENMASQAGMTPPPPQAAPPLAQQSLQDIASNSRLHPGPLADPGYFNPRAMEKTILIKPGLLTDPGYANPQVRENMQSMLERQAQSQNMMGQYLPGQSQESMMQAVHGQQNPDAPAAPQGDMLGFRAEALQQRQQPYFQQAMMPPPQQQSFRQGMAMPRYGQQYSPDQMQARYQAMIAARRGMGGQ
jgi:hypothetical protein